MRRTFDLLSFSSHLIFRIVIGVDMYIDVCYHCAIAECVLCFVCVCGAELAMSMCDYVYLIYIKFMCMDA